MSISTRVPGRPGATVAPAISGRRAPRTVDPQTHAELVRRVGRILIILATITLAGGGAWVGIAFHEYLDRIIVTALTAVAVPYAIYAAIRFFRDPDD